MPIRLFCQLAVLISLAEEKRDAPNARQGDDGVNDTADEGALPTTDPSDDIKLEKADAAPVERADNGKDQRNTIQNHDCDHIPFFGSCLKRRASLAAKHSVKDSMRRWGRNYTGHFYAAIRQVERIFQRLKTIQNRIFLNLRDMDK